MAQELDLNNLTPQQKADIMYAYDSQPKWTTIAHADGTQEQKYVANTHGSRTTEQYAESWDYTPPEDYQMVLGLALSNPDFATAYTVQGYQPLREDPEQRGSFVPQPSSNPQQQAASAGQPAPVQQPIRTTGAGQRVENTLSMENYALDPQAQADISTIRDMASSVYGRDPSRYDVDPYAIPTTEAFTYDPSTADIYTTDLSGVFDPTRAQYGYASDMLDYASNLEGTDLASAAELQYLAATGQAPSAADLALNRDANALFAQQMAMAARARGSSSSGLATMNAQNNSALGYAQLVNAADIARATEMATARGQYGQTGLGIRQQDMGIAGQAADIASGLFQVNNSELGGMQENTRVLNDGTKFNVVQENDAFKYGAGAMQDASGRNQDATIGVFTGNSNRAADVGKADDVIGASYADKLIGVGQYDTDTRIRGGQDYQSTQENIQTIDNNYDVGLAGPKANMSIAAGNNQAQEDAAIIGAISTGITGAGQLVGGYIDSQNRAQPPNPYQPLPPSDERVKKVGHRSAPADFSEVEPYEWEYEEGFEGAPGTEWTGGQSMKSGMAQDFPDSVVETGPDGVMRVNPMKAMMRYADSIGDLQRRINKMEKR